ncbi:MAG: Glu-tRNA(Gln) amidotransferase subunit GatD [Candidatus Thorarchaeota archaeon]
MERAESEQHGFGYRGTVLEKLRQARARVGDVVEIVTERGAQRGILMPRALVGSDPDHVVIKIDSGYNIGLRLGHEAKVSLVTSSPAIKSKRETPVEPRPEIPTIAMLSTGGTIASRVDYRTGSVNPALSAWDLYEAVPEISERVNVRARVVMSELSENIYPSDWTKIANAVVSEIRRGIDGVVVVHGTDTMAYTSAALAFSVQHSPVPIVLVGAQRSSDRPSSDAFLNLASALNIASRADAAEVMLCMHSGPSDSSVYAHRATRVKKLHTSRRDAFRSIDSLPLFRATATEIEELSVPLLRRDSSRKVRAKTRFDDSVLLIKSFPGLRESLIKHAVEAGYKGLVIEGTGLGHVPSRLLPSVKSAIDSGLVVALTSQCIWGRVNLNVYRTGVELLELGAVPCGNMLSETALVKMMWLLANTSDSEEVAQKMPIPLVGEINSRTMISDYDIDGA